MYKRKSKYTNEMLSAIVVECNSVAQVLAKLNLKCTGGNYTMIQSRIKNYDIDISHFKGKAWSKGLTNENSDLIKKARDKNSYSDEDILKEKSPQTKGPQLKKLMIKYGKEYKCEFGHEPIWLDKPLTLHVDHKNGDRTDNRLDNLRFLCPNCHQQTDTWGNINR